MSLGEGFGVGFGWVVGGSVSVWEMREQGKGDGDGRGWGGDRQRNRQVNAHVLFNQLPFGSSLTEQS